MHLLQFLTNFIVFIAGAIGVVLKAQNILTILMCLEIMFLSINLWLIQLSDYFDDVRPQVFALLVLTVCAADAAAGLSVLISFYRLRHHVKINVPMPINRY